MNKKAFLLLSLFCYTLLSFSLISCVTTKLDIELANTDKLYIVEDKLDFPDSPKDYKYIFIRLYDPKYSNPLYIANLLKGGMSVTELSEDIVSHSSINSSLDDNYYGLTMGGKFQLTTESCTNVKNHKYMSKCDPKTSTQITFAIKVKTEEAEKIKQSLEAYSKDPLLTYDTFANFKIGIFEIGRKFFTPKKYQGLKKNYLPNVRKKDVKNFVCSTFIAYILINNVPEIEQWFKKHNFDYSYIGVSDLTHIPGMTKLFSSTWENYNIAAFQFTQEYPEFQTYLNK